MLHELTRAVMLMCRRSRSVTGVIRSSMVEHRIAMVEDLGAILN